MRVCVTAAVFHSSVEYGFSNKDNGYCASARRPLDGTFNGYIGLDKREKVMAFMALLLLVLTHTHMENNKCR